MSDPHRGAYTPNSDEPLSFDARQPVRGRGQAPVTLLLSLAILAVLVVGIFFVYRGGVRGADDAPQPVGTPVASIKDKAPAQPQNADPASGLQIYKTETDEGAPTFAPPPETPQARPTTPVQIAVAPPVGQVPATPAPAQAAPPSPPPLPVTVAKAPTAAPVPAAPPPAAKPAAPAQTASAAGAGSAVQIGAFSSQALADKGWSDAARIAPAMAAGKGKSVQAIEVNGQTLYRTAVTGFDSRATATAFCSALKAAGKSCFVR
jgi:cell division protein FtsN